MADPRKSRQYRTNRLLVLNNEQNLLCAICGNYVDKSLKHLAGAHNVNCRREGCSGCKYHPWRPEVDHIISLNDGGHPWDLSNLALVHSYCNKIKLGKSFSRVTEIEIRKCKQAWMDYFMPTRKTKSTFLLKLKGEIE